jgi:hypothetical protein
LIGKHAQGKRLNLGPVNNEHGLAARPIEQAKKLWRLSGLQSKTGGSE